VKKNPTIIISDLENSLIKIKLLLQHNELIIFPTETVYGIGASIYSDDAIHKIYKIKGRPQDNPLIVHIANEKQIHDLIIDPPLIAKTLMDAFWPGPLTLVFKKSTKVSDLITANLDTVAIRMPSHPVAKKLLTLINIPLCAPSANFSGKPSGTTFESVLEDFHNKVAMIVQGEPSSIGIESTVLDISKRPYTILRPGAISKEDIEAVLNEKVLTSFVNHAPQSPGMKYTHYKPYGDVVILDGDAKAIQKYLLKYGSDQSVFIGATEICQTLSMNTIALGSLKSLDTIAQNLYRVLRQLDHLKIKTIYTHTVDRKGIGEAIMNRLEKAAENHIVDLRKVSV
jgi:L-threonylcarbamoyladenylate synthase